MTIAFIAVVANAASCGDRIALEPGCGASVCPPERTFTDLLKLSLRSDLDVLFVVDDTPAVEPRRVALVDELRRAAQVFENTWSGGLPRIHLEIARGSLPPGSPSDCRVPPARGAECGLEPLPGFLSTSSCGRMPNFVGTFDEVVSCLGDLGSGSCGTFQPLEVVRRALDPSDALAGFSRPSADLVVIVIGATDDASTHDGGPALVTDFVAFLKGLKGGRGPELVFVVGPPAGCAGGAAPASAPRLHELADAFGWRGVYSALCAEHPLASLSLGSESVDPACLAPVVDTDLETPGLQADCVVEDETWDATGPHRMTLPACEHAAAPCWRLTSSPQTCPTGELLEVDRGPGYCGQDGFDIQVTCLGCAKPGDPGCVRAR